MLCPPENSTIPQTRHKQTIKAQANYKSHHKLITKQQLKQQLKIKQPKTEWLQINKQKNYLVTNQPTAKAQTSYKQTIKAWNSH